MGAGAGRGRGARSVANRVATLAVGVAGGLFVVLVMLLAPALAPYDPNRLSLAVRLAPPSWQHLFGTDEVGRDLFSRVIFGSRASVVAGLATVALSMAVVVMFAAVSIIEDW